MNITRCWVRHLFPFRWSSSKSFGDTRQSLTRPASSRWMSHFADAPDAKLAHSDYFAEYLPNVTDFLFNAAGESGSRYFQIKETATPPPLNDGSPVWLRELKPDEKTAASLRPPGSPHGLRLLGAGIMSLCHCGRRIQVSLANSLMVKSNRIEA